MAQGFNLTAQINLRGPSNVRQVVSDIRRQLTGINANVNVQLNQQNTRQVAAMNRSFQDLNATLQQTNNLAAATSRTFAQLGNAAGNLSNNLRNIPANINQAAQAANNINQTGTRAAAAVNNMTTEFEEFGRQSALAVRRFAAFATVTGVIYRVSNAISKATKDFIDFDQQLVKVSQVTDTPVQSLDFLVRNITRLSTGLGVASQDLIQVSQTLAQAGLSASETSTALQALARSALAPSFDNLNATVEGSIALMRQFGISANQLEGALGSINAVAAKFAVEASDIITAISRTGGVFASASKGVSEGTNALNEFIAVFTSVRATTRESAETIATGLRTIFTRIQREDTINALKEYGVALTDLSGKFVGPYEAVRRLSEGLNQLDPRSISFSRIVEELGGFRQIGKVIPLIQQFSTAQQALNVAQQGSGSLARDAAVAQLSLSNQITKVREEFSALIRSIGQTSEFKDLVRLTLDLTSGLIQIADAAKGALPALTAIFAIRGFQALTQFSRGFAGGLRRGGGGGQQQGLNKGGYVRHFATGGMVPGTGNRDTVPAMLQPGEFVIRKKAVETIGASNLNRMNKYAGGGRVKKFAVGGLAKAPLVDDILQAQGAILPRPRYAVEDLIRAGGGGVDVDRTLIRTVGDKAYGSAKTSGQQTAALNTYFRDPRRRLQDITSSPLTTFGKELQAAIKSGKIDPNNISVVSKSKRVPGVDTYLNQLFGIPIANMAFTEGKSKEDAMTALRTKGPRVARVNKAFGGFIQKFANGGLIEHLQTDKRVGAAILEQGEFRQEPISITKQALEQSLNTKLDSSKLPSFRGITAAYEGLGPETYQVFDQALNDGIINGVNSTVSIISGKLGLQAQTISKEHEQSFLNGINVATRGNLFEDVLLALKEGPGPFSERQAGQPFDFPSGLPSSLQDDYQNLPKAWVDAKASFATATRSDRGLQQKTLRQLKNEIQPNLNYYAAGSASTTEAKTKSLEQTKAETLDEALLAGKLKAYDPKDPGVKAKLEGMGLKTYKDQEDIIKAIRSGKIPSRAGVARDRVLNFLQRAKGGPIPKPAPGAEDVLEKYYADSASTNLALANSKSLSKEARQSLAKDVRAMRSLRTPAPQQLYSAISSVAFDTMARQIGFNKNIAQGVSPFKEDELFKQETNKIIGQSFQLPGFVSTSKDYSVAKRFLDNAPRTDRFGAMLNILTKPEAMGIDTVQSLAGRDMNITKTDINPRTGKPETYMMDKPEKEQEVILQPRSRFRINSAKFAGFLAGNKNLWLDVQQFAKGGSAEDTVPALLTPGEFVINKKAASRLGASKLNQLNRADRIQGYNKGGFVGVQKFQKGGRGAPGDFEARIEKILMQLKEFEKNIYEGARASGKTAQEARRTAQVATQSRAGVLVQEAMAPVGTPKKGQNVEKLEQKRKLNIDAALQASARYSDKILQTHQQSSQVTQRSVGFFERIFNWSQRSSQAQQAGAQAQIRSSQAQQQNIPAPDADGRDRRGGLLGSMGNIGGLLAFTGPMLAQQIGQSIGGETGAGVASAATSISTYAGIGAQFGTPGLLIGGFLGALDAVDSFSKGVASAALEINSSNIGKASEAASSALEQLGRNPQDNRAMTNVITNLQTIAAEEEKITANREKAEAPGIIGRFTQAVGISKADTPELIAAKRASDQKTGAEQATQFIQAQIAAGKSYADIDKALRSQGSSVRQLEQQIIESIPAYQEEKAAIERMSLSEDSKTLQINNLKSRYIAQNTQALRNLAAEKERELAAAKLARAVNIVSISITKTFDNMNQAINAVSYDLDRASSEIDNMISGTKGFSANLRSVNILQNPRAYGANEQNAAIQQAGAGFGADRVFVQRLARFSLDMEDTMTRLAAEEQQRGGGVDQSGFGDRILRELTAQLEAAFGRGAVTEKIRGQLTQAIQEQAKSKEGFDIEKILESANLSQLTEASKQAFESLKNSLEIAAKSMDFFSDAAQKAAAMNEKIRDRTAQSQNIILQSNMALKRALGQRVDISEERTARRNVAATRAGVSPDQFTLDNLMARRQSLTQQRDALAGQRSSLMQSFDRSSAVAVKNFQTLTTQLARTEEALKTTEQALDSLPQTIEANINDIINEIGRIRQETESRQQGAAAFGEKLVGSTPQELAELGQTFNLLNGTLNGQLTTIQQSRAAQLAYQQAIRNGQTQQEAMSAAQQAFAGETRNALSLFNELSQLSGLEGPEINRMRADLLENFARAQGMGVQNNPMFRSILELLRREPQADPQIQALQQLLAQEQQSLIQTTTQLNQATLDRQASVLDTANKKFIDALNNVQVKFDTAQLQNMGLGVSRPAQGMAPPPRNMNRGGVVYASDGAYVNFQPKGTDTIPAMLTPGEFVVNAKAAKNNLGLLRNINSTGSGKTYSRGGVVYAAGGLLASLGFNSWDDFANAQAAAETTEAAKASSNATTGGYFPTLRTLFAKLRLPKVGIRQLLGSMMSGTGSMLGKIGRADIAKMGAQLGGSIRSGGFSLLENLAAMGRYGLQAIKMDIDSMGSLGNTIKNFGSLPPVDPTDAAAAGSLKDLKVGLGGAFRTVGRLLGPTLGAAFGAMEDPNQTGRSRSVNAVFGALGAGSTTMGDVGATSITGSQTGGNLLQAGLTTAQYMSYGLDPITASLAAAGTLSAQEIAGYMGDVSNTQASEARLEQQVQNQRQEGRVLDKASMDADERRAVSLVEQRGGVEKLEGFSATERNWLAQRAQLDNSIESLDSNGDGIAELPKNQSRLDQLKQNREEHNATKKTIFSKATFGWFGENQEATKTDAEINSALQKERRYRQRLDVARQQVAVENEERQSAREQAMIDNEARIAEAKEYGLGENASWSEVVQARIRKKNEADIASKQKAEEDRKTRAANLGLKENASIVDIEQEEKRRKAISAGRLGLSVDATDEEIRMRTEQQQGYARQYAALNATASDAIRDSKKLPPTAYSKQWQTAVSERQEIQDKINELRTKIRDPNDPYFKSQEDFENYRKQELDDLYQQLDNKNKFIATETEAKKYDTLDYNGRENLWKQYRSNRDKELKAEQREKIRTENRLAKQQSDQIRAVAKYANIPVPDKFANPGAFFSWRNNLQKNLQKRLPFGSLSQEALSNLGLPSEAIQGLYEPFTAQQAEAVYTSMLSSTRLTPASYNIVSALRSQLSNIDQKVDKDPRLQQIIASASPAQQKEIMKQFESTFGKTVRQIKSFEMLTSRFSQLKPGQQNLARANLLQQLTKQGIINPRAKPEDNINRLNALQGSGIASFIYPNKQAQNAGIRINPKVKSRGGIIYASTGMLVPYEPRGTDTVPAMLTPGEFVVNRSATQKHRPLLEAINRNKGGAVKYLADGGTSTDVSKYVDGVAIEPPPDKRIDNILANTNTSNDLARLNRDNIQTNTRKVPDDNRMAQGKLDLILTNLENCCNTITSYVSDISGLLATAQTNIVDDINDALNTTNRVIISAIVAGQQGIAGAFPGGVNPAGLINPGNLVGMLSKGGVVYAADGTLVNYQPKGSDTVPAMLTPGEFVINKQATQQNLPLLQAINNGYYADGGAVGMGGSAGMIDRRTEYLKKKISREEQEEFRRLGLRYSDNTSSEIIKQALLRNKNYLAEAERYAGLFETDANLNIRLKRYPRISEAAQQILSKASQPIESPFGKSPVKPEITRPKSVGTFSSGGIVYAQNGMEMQSQSNSYIPSNLVNINDIRGLTNTKNDLVGKLIPYTSGPEGIAKLFAMSQQNFGIQRIHSSLNPNAKVDASYSGQAGSPYGMIQTKGDFVDKNLLQHEIGHGIQNFSGNFGRQANINLYRILGNDINKFLTDPDGWPKIQQEKNTFYSAKDLQQNPHEIFTNLIQYIDDPAFIQNQMGQDLLKKIMRAYGFNKGGIVYAQKGGLFDDYGHYFWENLKEAGLQTESFVYGAAKSILPTLTGAGVASVSGPAGPVTGIAAGVGAARAQENYLNALAPELNQYINDRMNARPFASLGGSAIGGGVTRAGGNISKIPELFSGSIKDRAISGVTGGAFSFGMSAIDLDLNREELMQAGRDAVVSSAIPGNLQKSASNTLGNLTTDRSARRVMTGDSLGNMTTDRGISRRIATGDSLGNMTTDRGIPSRIAAGDSLGNTNTNQGAFGKLELKPGTLDSYGTNRIPTRGILGKILEKIKNLSKKPDNEDLWKLPEFQTKTPDSAIEGVLQKVRGSQTALSLLAGRNKDLTALKSIDKYLKDHNINIPSLRLLSAGRESVVFDTGDGQVFKIGYTQNKDVQELLKSPGLESLSLPSNISGVAGYFDRQSIGPYTVGFQPKVETLDYRAQKRFRTDNIGIEIQKYLTQQGYEGKDIHPGNVGYAPQGASGIPTSMGSLQVIDGDIRPIHRKQRGGIVYANNGMLIPYQPKGTDTVPAMLTPGEFVINRQATQQHLPLLQAINNGYSAGGIVSYLEDGGFAAREKERLRNLEQQRIARQKEISDAKTAAAQKRSDEMTLRRTAYLNARTQGTPITAQMTALQPQRANPGPQPQQQMVMAAQVNQAAQAAFNPQAFGNINQQFATMGTLLTGINQSLVRFGTILQQFQAVNVGNAGNNANGVNINGIAQFVQRFDNFVQQLSKINIPSQINLQLAPLTVSVNLTGADALSSIQPQLQSVIMSQIGASLEKWVGDNFDGMSPPTLI